MPNMFSGIGEIKISCSWAGVENTQLQCQKDLSDHNYLPLIMINGVRGQETSDGYHVFEYIQLQSPRESTLCLFLEDQWIVSST